MLGSSSDSAAGWQCGPHLERCGLGPAGPRGVGRWLAPALAWPLGLAPALLLRVFPAWWALLPPSPPPLCCSCCAVSLPPPALLVAACRPPPVGGAVGGSSVLMGGLRCRAVGSGRASVCPVCVRVLRAFSAFSGLSQRSSFPGSPSVFPSFPACFSPFSFLLRFYLTIFRFPLRVQPLGRVVCLDPVAPRL